MDPDLLNSLSYNEQQQLMASLQDHEATNSINMNTYVIEHCFNACITDFTSKAVSKKEEVCLGRCVDKFTNYTRRLTLRFQENQATLGEKFQGPDA
ncbi:hypothetical protein BC831DRAFT_442545 [Entophlyctis helioformis]|nr:hypothetical protein BC831DRAFT_442545 [Entophlyctis helioformis]